MRLKYKFVVTPLAGQQVAVQIDNGKDEDYSMIKMNKVAQSIFHCLEEETSVPEIVEKLSKQYDATEEQLTRGVEDVLTMLREGELLDE